MSPQIIRFIDGEWRLASIESRSFKKLERSHAIQYTSDLNLIFKAQASRSYS
jgi:hypothetical protein